MGKRVRGKLDPKEEIVPWECMRPLLLSDSGRKPSTTKKLLQWQIGKEALRQNATEEDSLTEEDLKTIALEQVLSGA